MDRYGKIIGIVIGFVLLAVLAFYIAPQISTMMNPASALSTSQSSDTDDPDGVKSLTDFLADMNTTSKHSYCAIKTVSNTDEQSKFYYGCTIRGADYSVKSVEEDRIHRQLFIDGKYIFIDDTEKTVYPNVQIMDFPDTRFQEALAGKVISFNGEIIDGNQLDCVQMYKDGTVYALYFNQQGEMIRFYYIYDSNEIAIDFCGFYFGDEGEFAPFDIPATYKQGIWNPSKIKSE